MATNPTDCNALVDAVLDRWQHRPENGAVSDEETSHAAAEILNDLAGILCHAAAYHRTLDGIFSEQVHQQIMDGMDAAVRRLLDAAMAGKPLPGARIFLDDPDGTSVSITFRLGEFNVRVFFDHWRPIFQADASDLRTAFDPIWRADVPLKEGIKVCRKNCHTVTLLLDNGSLVLDKMQETKTRLVGADRIMRAIEDPANWAGPLPAEAHIWRVDIEQRETEAAE